jgi:N6-adenosine-specific RNA methylase IME4
VKRKEEKVEKKKDVALVKMTQARKALAEAKRVGAIAPIKGIKQLKTIRDQAEVIKAYLKKIGAGFAMQNEAAEIKIDAQRDMGLLLKGLVKAGRLRRGRPSKKTHDALFLKDLDLEDTESSRCQMLAQMPEKEFSRHKQEVFEKALELTTAGLIQAWKALLRAAEIDTLDDTIVTPEGTYSVIVLDPPWPYGTKYDPKSRRVANPYPEMSLEDIAALEIPAADDCILWLWTTHKFMRHSFPLLDAWGFRDVAILTWLKHKIGIGAWLRSQSEFCIMAVKGNPKVKLTNQTTIIQAKAKEHSRKPDEFYSLVESLCVGKKAEGFSREKRKGWTQIFSNEPEKFSE